MNRLLRWAFNFAAAVSVVLLIAMVCLLARSREVSDAVFVNNGRFLIGVYSRWGRIEFAVYDMRGHRADFANFVRRAGWMHFREWANPNGGSFPRLRFDLPVRPNNPLTVITPDLAWVAVSFCVMLVWYARRRARSHMQARRRRNGLCTSCGYDLRASLDRCRECGAVPTVSN